MGVRVSARTQEATSLRSIDQVKSSIAFRSLIWLAVAVALSYMFWAPLYTGGGLIAGDVYSYFLPQKAVYADQLQSGKVPLWNHRTGYGYPQLAESQTGVFYPFHLVLYRLLDLNSAYSAVHLLHYVLTFLFAVLYLRRLGSSGLASCLGAVVITYAWFPVRCCWEWAIVTGCWFVAALWLLESYLQTHSRWYWRAMVAAVVLQLLAGHFTLAFVTQLTLLAYVPLRGHPRESESDSSPTPVRWRAACQVFLAIALALALAAVQLVPTFELKLHSQRAEVRSEHQLEFGSIPPQTLTQLANLIRTRDGWRLWSDPHTPRDRLLDESGVRTNQVEASLYCGIAPLLLALLASVHRFAACWRGPGGSCSESGPALERLSSASSDPPHSNPTRRIDGRSEWFWILAGTAAAVYGTGCLLPYLDWLPGFSYFQGPGRFGLVTTVAIGVLAASAVDRLMTVGGKLNTSVAAAALMISATHLLMLLQRVLAAGAVNSMGFDVGAVWMGGSLTFDAILALVILPIAVAGVLGLVHTLRRPAVRRVPNRALAAGLLLTSLFDLWSHSQLVTYSTVVDQSPVSQLDQSAIGELFRQQELPVRCVAPGANMFTLLEISTLPVYLTFGPDVYPQENRVLAEAYLGAEVTEQSAAMLRDRGVTHLVSLQPLRDENDQLELLWSGRDAVFSVALAHAGRGDEILVYRLRSAENAASNARFALFDSAGQPRPAGEVELVSYEPDRVELQVNCSQACRLELYDLDYPGWRLEVDETHRSTSNTVQRKRQVELPPGGHRVRWLYRPTSLYWGLAISLTAAIGLAWYPLTQSYRRGNRRAARSESE